MKFLGSSMIRMQALFVFFLLVHYCTAFSKSYEAEKGADVVVADIGMTPSEVLDITSSEMETELASLLQLSDPSSTASSTAGVPSQWLTQTAAVWDAITRDSEKDGCEYKKYNSATPMMDQLFPLLVCDSTPDKSDNERHQVLDELIAVVEEPKKESEKMSMMSDTMPMEHVTPNIFIRGLVNSAKLLYSRDDKTCWIMTSTSCLARKLYANADQSNGLLQVQPMLPMMKVRKGTMDAISTALSSQNPTLKLNFELSPSTLEYENIKFSVSQWLLGSQRSSKSSQKELRDTFPYTSMGTQLQGGFSNGEDPFMVLWPHITPMYLRGEIALQIDLSSLYPGRGYSMAKTADQSHESLDAESEEKLKIAILAVISAVVSKGEIISAEIPPTIGFRGLRGSLP
jgi:hypothetical protein